MVIRHALLALLSEGPKHGFQLAQEFAAGTGEMWPLNTGQVYTTLQRLDRDGLVESDGAESGTQTIIRDHRSGTIRVGDVASTSARHDASAARRAGDQGARGIAASWGGCERTDPGVSTSCRGSDAAVHAAEGGRPRGRHRAAARRRRGDLSARCHRPLARCCRGADQTDATERLASCDADSPAASCSDRIEPMTAVLDMVGVSKSYGDGAGTGARPARCRLDRAGR